MGRLLLLAFALLVDFSLLHYVTCQSIVEPSSTESTVLTMITTATTTTTTTTTPPTTTTTPTPSCDYDSSSNVILCRYLQSPNIELLVQALQETSQFVTSFGVEIQYSDGAAIPNDIFTGYNIDYLSMSDNGFEEIPYQLLSGIDSALEYLYLGYDNLGSMAATTLFLPFSDKLTELYVEHSDMTSVDLAAFAQYAILDTLSLSYNIFKDVGLQLIGLQTLESLDLDNNFIRSIETGAFRDFGNLQSLNLANNELSYLQEGAFLGIENASITEIHLENNPWNCTCELQWLKDWLTSLNLTESSGAYCSYPSYGPFADISFCPSDYNLQQAK